MSVRPQPDPVKRPYVAPRRAAQARLTKRRITTAAADLFVERGFVATSVDAVAAAAGVGRATVFAHFPTKAALLKAAYDVTLVGDDEPVPLRDRPRSRAVMAETDAHRFLAGYAGIVADIARRLAPIYVAIRAAASADAEAAAVWDALNAGATRRRRDRRAPGGGAGAASQGPRSRSVPPMPSGRSRTPGCTTPSCTSAGGRTTRSRPGWRRSSSPNCSSHARPSGRHGALPSRRDQPDTLHVSSHPAVLHKLAVLRDVDTEPKKFREVVRELSWLLGYEALQDAKTKPLDHPDAARGDGRERARGADRARADPAGRPGHGRRHARADADGQVWHLGLFRDERTLRPVEYYNKLPDSASVDLCLILDPMLATGGSATAAIDVLKRWGAVQPVRIKLINLIAAPEGVAAVQAAHPDVHIHCAALDRGLNEKGYIMPGLGDAGDRQFGTGKTD